MPGATTTQEATPPSTGGMRRIRRRIRVVGASVAGLGVVAALLWWLLPYVGVPVSAGPLDAGSLGNSRVGGSPFPLRVGTRFTYGMDQLTVPADHGPAVITGIHVDGGGSGLRYLGARLGAPSRRGDWQLIRGFPPAPGPVHASRPLDTPITAAPGRWELYLGFQIASPGRYVVRGIDITYQVAGHHYRQHVTGNVVMCTHNLLGFDTGCPRR